MRNQPARLDHVHPWASIVRQDVCDDGNSLCQRCPVWPPLATGRGGGAGAAERLNVASLTEKPT